jgi:NAD(P)-dependent dehydrogenase (short-subunit alcohol dehydrogenase family)
MSDLSKQTVVIVGASSGIGLAAARAAAARGAETIMVSRSRAPLEEAARAVGGAARAVPMDMMDRAEVDRTFASIGPFDHLVLTAAGEELAYRGKITDLTNEDVERAFDKFRGFVNVTRAAAPLLRGSLTLTSGTSAERPPAGFSILAAVSASVVSFGKALVLELAPVRVNILMPGIVDTPRHGDRREGIRAWAESPTGLPARHFGQPEDIAEAIVFLMTNRYMAGHTLIIDGGGVAT